VGIKLEDITGVVVTYNTKDMLETCLKSIRTFYPDLKIIIMDGSEQNNPCYEYVRNIEDKNIKPVSLGFNIGHGDGLDRGIKMAETDFVATIDSDIIMKKPPIEEMLKLFEEDTFGVGELQHVNKRGINIPSGDKKAILYMHPFFQIINKRIYGNFPPYVHHGAPCILTMIDIHKKKLSGRILKDFPVREYIRHDWEGTRKLDPLEFKSGWVTYKSVSGYRAFFRGIKNWFRNIFKTGARIGG